MGIEATRKLGAISSRRRRSLWKGTLRFLRYKPLGAVGAFVILLVVVLAVGAPWLSPHDAYEVRQDLLLQPPSRQFLLGTDNYGRDILTRIIWGARTSLVVAVAGIAVGKSLGLMAGLVSGYRGGTTDLVIQRFMDSLMAIPALVKALVLVAVLGASVVNVIIAIAIVNVSITQRVIRSIALSLKEWQYVDAARALGCSEGRIVFRHILPNTMAPFIILVTAGLASAILLEATLSFLGLGSPPPTPSWGGMLTGAAQYYVKKAPWMAIVPGLAISVTVFGFNVLGDALRDVMDPRLRR